MKTSENNWEHRKTSKIIWYHPENSWGPIIDNLVQFDEDFNSRTEKRGLMGIGYVRPDQFLDQLTPWRDKNMKKMMLVFKKCNRLSNRRDIQHNLRKK